MIVYHYSRTTGEFLASAEARLDPIDQQPMLPAFATFEAPPPASIGEAARMTETGWEVVPDYRGLPMWDTATGQSLGVVTELGELPEGATLDEPTQPEPTIEEARAAKMGEIRDQADALLQSLGAEYGPMERTTWDVQAAEAAAFAADPEADVPLLSGIAVHRGMTVADMAARVLANRTAWVALSGAVVGQRLALQDQLDAAADIATIEAIEVSYVLPG